MSDIEAPHARTFSPRDLARAIGVSESSIKRWVDDDLMDVIRTAGGHRRILLPEALRFVRSRGMRVLKPELLGLPDVSELPAEARQGELTADVLYHLLSRGEAAKARGSIIHRYVSGADLAQLFDGPIAGALAQLGVLWKHGEEGIYVEHLATGICLEAVHQLRALIPPAPAGAPIAVGGAPSGDPYLLPSLIAATVLSEAGIAAINLGPDTPLPAFLSAVEAHDPRMVWVAWTAHVDESKRMEIAENLFLPLVEAEVDVIVGGQQAAAHAWPEGVRVMTSMAELERFAANLRGED